MEKATKRKLKKLRQEAAALKLEQGPSEEDPQVRQISPSGALTTVSFNLCPAPAGARVRQSVLYSDRPRQSKRSSRVEEFEALTLDQLPPARHSTHRPAGTATRVWQSALYSGRPRQSRGRQEQEPSQNKLLVEENASMVSGSEIPTGDLPELKALALNEAPPKSELSDRSTECDTSSSETDIEVVVEEEPEDESDFDLEEAWRKLNEYKERMFDKDFDAQSATLAASCDKNSAVENVTEYSGIAEWAKRAYLRQDKSLKDLLNARHTVVVPSRDEPTCEVSDEAIIENGKKWMSEEVMVAFNEYIRRNVKLKKLMHRFEELCHQCFNVECYFKIFHHFNFTVKTKLPSSDDWKLRTYFAEVKEIFGEKFYFCCPLESSENGQCYACSNQGVNDLRHPATGGFERGLPDTVFPYM